MYSEKGLSERGMKVPSFTVRLYRGRRKMDGYIQIMGSGAVGEAALLEGRRFVGIEIEPAFFAIAHMRLERAAHRVSLITITCEQRQLRFEEAHL